MTTNLHILVLAAGASTRLGQPKQLVRMEGLTLLERTCQTALSIENRGVTVVLGAHCGAIRPAVEHLPVNIVVNENWALGMGTTIACGMASLPPDADAVLLLLCDQPFVSLGLLKDLVEKWQQHPKPYRRLGLRWQLRPTRYFRKGMFRWIVGPARPTRCQKTDGAAHKQAVVG
ncbi:MAG: nucleotidyltransferase family protein [Saprospiraceae bacterium]|nr:nucleotidyltransferase family protein [Saprospiraceae bacterium]